MPQSRTGLIIFALTSILLSMPHSSALGPQSTGPSLVFSTNIETKMIIDSRGAVHLLWAVPALNGSGPAPGIWYSKYESNGNGSIPPILIRNSSLVQSADMAVDRFGNPHTAWAEGPAFAQISPSALADGSGSKLYYAEINLTDPHGITPTALTGGEGLLMWPSIAIENDLTTHIVWTRNDLGARNAAGVYYGLMKNNSAISQTVLIASYNTTFVAPPRPHIAYDVSSDDLHVAWTERIELPSGQVSSSVSYARLDLRSKNVTRFEVAKRNELLDDATVALGPRGNAYVVWEAEGGPGSSNLVYVAQISRSGKINFLRQLSRPGQIAGALLTVSADSQDNLYVIWYQPSVPSLGHVPQVSSTATSISYLKLEADGSVTGSWNDVVAEPVIVVTISNSGDLYAVSQSGIIRVVAPTNLFSIQIIAVVLATSVGLTGAAAVEDFRYRLLRPFARVTRRGARRNADECATEEDGILKVLSHNPGLRLRDLRGLLPQEKLTMIRLALLERQGYVSSVRTGVKRRFYYSGHSSNHSVTVAYEAIPSRIVNEIEQNPGIWEAKLAQNLALSQQIVHYHLRKLRTGRFLTTESVGKRKHYWLAGSSRQRESVQTS